MNELCLGSFHAGRGSSRRYARPSPSFPARSWNWELVKTRREITVKEIEESTGANRNIIKVHVRKLAE